MASLAEYFKSVGEEFIVEECLIIPDNGVTERLGLPSSTEDERNIDGVVSNNVEPALEVPPEESNDCMIVSESDVIFESSEVVNDTINCESDVTFQSSGFMDKIVSSESDIVKPSEAVSGSVNCESAVTVETSGIVNKIFSPVSDVEPSEAVSGSVNCKYEVIVESFELFNGSANNESGLMVETSVTESGLDLGNGSNHIINGIVSNTVESPVEVSQEESSDCMVVSESDITIKPSEPENRFDCESDFIIESCEALNGIANCKSGIMVESCEASNGDHNNSNGVGSNIVESAMEVLQEESNNCRIDSETVVILESSQALDGIVDVKSNNIVKPARGSVDSRIGPFADYRPICDCELIKDLTSKTSSRFLLSLLPDMAEMNTKQKSVFKRKIVHLLTEVDRFDLLKEE